MRIQSSSGPVSNGEGFGDRAAERTDGQGPGSVPDGPLLQSIGIGFLVLRLATILLCVAWLFGNSRMISPGSQAVVLRLGAVSRVLPPGLALAWPRPFERLVTLPGPDRQMMLRVQATPSGDPGTFLTADGEVVLLDAALGWRISDPAAYYLARSHVAPALRRVFLAVATEAAASHPLDDFLAVRPERAHDPAAQDARVAIRAELVRAMNRRLVDLAAAGTPLGVEITRADVTPLLPPLAKQSFDAVLDAAQQADEVTAAARTMAVHLRQQADRDRDRVLAEAHAGAAERIGAAHAQTATVSALEAGAGVAGRPAMLLDLYRTRVGAVLRQAGSVSAVGAADGRVLLPGPGSGSGSGR